MLSADYEVELPLTILCYNLNSGLCLELQVFCETGFTQILDQYWAAARLPRGWSVYIVHQGLFINLLEKTQFS